MNDPSKRSGYIKRVLKERGNPYWSLQLDSEQSEARLSVDQRDKLREHIRLLENPYAAIDLAARSAKVKSQNAKTVSADSLRKQRLTGISKTHFRARCQQIFSRYVPEIENGRLRRHQKEFISRNEARSPIGRAFILGHLRKYDLSDLTGSRTHFNRQEALTENKLKQIELLVDNEEANIHPNAYS